MEENIDKEEIVVDNKSLIGKQANENKISVFTEIAGMNRENAMNILIQAAEQAHRAGILTIRDSIYIGAAIEIITDKPI